MERFKVNSTEEIDEGIVIGEEVRETRFGNACMESGHNTKKRFGYTGRSA